MSKARGYRGKLPHLKEVPLLCLVLLAAFSYCSASRYYLDENYAESRLSEGYMYATDAGPLGSSGQSYIGLEGKVRRNNNVSLQTSMAFTIACATVQSGYYDLPFDGCPDSVPHINNSAPVTSSYSTYSSFLTFFEYVELPPNQLQQPVNVTCPVEIEGLQYIILSSCRLVREAQSNTPGSNISFYHTDQSLHYDGNIMFKNPFGWLPAKIYGMLPFCAVLALAYIALDLCFILFFCRHRKSTLWLQWWILPVLLLSTVETISWWYSYNQMNINGEPPCCPIYRPLTVAITLEIVSKAMARILLLSVSLGFGVVRPKLQKQEIFLITSLALCYIVSSVASKFYKLDVDSHREETDVGEDEPTMWMLLELITNATFALWIYLALSLTRKSLKEARQTAKYRMYSKLFWIVIFYVITTAVFVVVSQLVLTGQLEMPWKWQWLVSADAWAIGRLLNFLLVAAICIIWRPSPKSYIYAYSYQLPASDGGDGDVETGIELSSLPAPDSMEELEDRPQRGLRQGGKNIQSAVPPATGTFTISEDDDDEFVATPRSMQMQKKAELAGGRRAVDAQTDNVARIEEVKLGKLNVSAEPAEAQDEVDNEAMDEEKGEKVVKTQTETKSRIDHLEDSSDEDEISHIRSASGGQAGLSSGSQDQEGESRATISSTASEESTSGQGSAESTEFPSSADGDRAYSASDFGSGSDFEESSDI